MSAVGRIESLWRYPVKSMGGERLPQLNLGAGGAEGDRLYAFRSSAAPESFPYFTAREQPRMLLYHPRFAAGRVVVETPEGAQFAIDDPRLVDTLRRGADTKHEVTLMRSERPLADAFPVSVISRQTCAQLSAEAGTPLDLRRFRANLYLDLGEGAGYGEEQFIGRQIRLGEKVTLAIVKRDIRCSVIDLDPERAERTPGLLKHVGRAHGGAAGVYATVMVDGIVREGDSVEMLD